MGPTLHEQHLLFAGWETSEEEKEMFITCCNITNSGNQAGMLTCV